MPLSLSVSVCSLVRRCVPPLTAHPILPPLSRYLEANNAAVEDGASQERCRADRRNEEARANAVTVQRRRERERERRKQTTDDDKKEMDGQNSERIADGGVTQYREKVEPQTNGERPLRQVVVVWPSVCVCVGRRRGGEKPPQQRWELEGLDSLPLSPFLVAGAIPLTPLR